MAHNQPLMKVKNIEPHHSRRSRNRSPREGCFGGSRDFRLHFEPLEGRVLLSGTPHLVSDINRIPTGSLGSRTTGLVDIAGTLFLSANDGTGYELWTSNGTGAGTVRVKDIRSGAAGANPGFLSNVGGTLYFTADHGTSGRELWTSDAPMRGPFT